MKNIYFILFVLFCLYSCSNESNDIPEPLISYKKIQSPIDTTISIAIGENEIILLKKNKEITKKKAYYNNKVIDLGYGQTEMVSFKNSYPIFLKDGIFLIQKPINMLYGKLFLATMYTYNLDSISSFDPYMGKEFLPSEVTTFGENSILIVKQTDAESLVTNIDISGNTIFFKKYPHLIHIPSLYSSINISNEEYFEFSESISRKNFNTGVVWENKLSYYIENTASISSHAPKLSIKSKSLSDDIIHVTLSVIYYSGHKEDIQIKIDASTGNKI